MKNKKAKTGIIKVRISAWKIKIGKIHASKKSYKRRQEKITLDRILKEETATK